MKIDILLFIIGIIFIVIVSFITTNNYHRTRFRKRYEIMKSKFVTYLIELDNENEHLYKQLDKKPRKKKDFSNLS